MPLNATQRPLAVTVLAWVYILVGAAGGVAHLTRFQAGGAFPTDEVTAELVELLAIIGGAFMLRGHNWARWLALAWIAFHVVLSAFHAFPELAVHSVFCAAIAWFLFRPDAARYFRRTPIQPT